MERPLTQNFGRQSCDYSALKKALRITPQAILNEVRQSDLKGRGGAGFVTGMKWSFVPQTPQPKYLIINADEMEPGTMKDRYLMEGDPFQLIEGAIISAYAIGASTIYLFLRGEYKLAAEKMQAAIKQAYDQRCLGENILGSAFSVDMHIHLSAGRYMCGEETGLLNALEGKRANPRSKPPFPATVGFRGKPTVVNNVETICNIPHIVQHGAAWFKQLSKTADGGTKIYGVSGQVQNPGLWELPMGTSARQILMEYAGGMRQGRKFRALLPGGASTAFILEEHLDLPMDFSSLHKAGSRIGTGTMIVLDDHTCPVATLYSLELFFSRESCGWCTPCREGLSWVADTLLAIENGQGKDHDLDILEEHVELLQPGHTFCPLAPGAMDPLKSALSYFRQDFLDHIQQKRCPWQ
jgi:NADH-quinone oxidoreductase subunit F